MANKILFGTILIFSVVSMITANTLYDIDFGLKEDVNCTKAGYMCNGCEESYFCAPVSGGFIPEKNEDCSNGQTCHFETGLCTSDFNMDCDPQNYKFVCHQRGTYPDPYRCNMYHMCCGDEGLTLGTYNCEDGYQFNPANLLCNKKEEPKCGILIQCKTAGESNVIPGGLPNMYYVCLYTENRKLHPQMFLCEGNFIFDNGVCKDPDNVETTTESTTDNSSPDIFLFNKYINKF